MTGTLRSILRRASHDAFLVLAGLLYLASLVHNDRFRQDDFRTYYRAAGQLVSGEPLYFVRSAEAPYLYRYPPAGALGFLPFRGLPIEAAAFAWYAVNVLLVIAVRRLLLRRMGPLRPALTAVFFLAIGFTLERELGVGNVNLVNLAACLLSVGLIERGRPMGGLPLACSVAIKPTNALLVIPAARTGPRTLAWFAVPLVALLAVPVPFYGAAGTVELYRDFLRSTVEFHQTFGDTFKYHGTTAGLVERALTPLGIALHRHPASELIGLGVALAAIAVAIRRDRTGPLAYWVAMALVPLTAMSDYQILMFVAPLIYWLLASYQTSPWPPARAALLAAALLLYGGNWHDLWGDRLSDLIFHLGLPGLGAWALVGLALWTAGASHRDQRAAPGAGGTTVPGPPAGRP